MPRPDVRFGRMRARSADLCINFRANRIKELDSNPPKPSFGGERRRCSLFKRPMRHTRRASKQTSPTPAMRTRWTEPSVAIVAIVDHTLQTQLVALPCLKLRNARKKRRATIFSSYLSGLFASSTPLPTRFLRLVQPNMRPTNTRSSSGASSATVSTTSYVLPALKTQYPYWLPSALFAKPSFPA